MLAKTAAERQPSPTSRSLLTSGRRTIARQQTLLASVEWSHALLTDDERILFRRPAVFAG